ncbi:MAG: thiamine biosynthesis protein [Frankiales bacterium]|jgi:thiamine biosynthesis lipoprotein|nr:thiamine biosynthesis protein [Frankiales bacterium]
MNIDLLSETGILHVEQVMGTTVTLDVRDQHLTRAELARAVLAAVEALHEADRMFSTFRPNSAISQLRRGNRQPEHLPADVVSVLVRCAAAAELTRGWFDPWAMPGGFDPTGLVKGWAAQRALRQLTRWGARHALVNAGGDIAVSGNATATPDGSGWAVGIQDPFQASGLLTTVRVREMSVATSGAYERGSLAIDPANGLPVLRLASATVIAADLALADACSTGAGAHGPDALLWLTAARGVEALLITLDGERLTTPGWPTGETLDPAPGA